MVGVNELKWPKWNVGPSISMLKKVRSEDCHYYCESEMLAGSVFTCHSGFTVEPETGKETIGYGHLLGA